MKLGKGRDATRSTIRKLALNFIQQGKIETTVARAKTLRSYIDRLLHKAQNEKEHAYRILMKNLNNKERVIKLIKVVAPFLNDRSFGFITIIRIGQRLGDGAEMSRVQWVKEIDKQKLKIKDKDKEHEGTSDKINKIS